MERLLRPRGRAVLPAAECNWGYYTIREVFCHITSIPSSRSSSAPWSIGPVRSHLGMVYVVGLDFEDLEVPGRTSVPWLPGWQWMSSLASAWAWSAEAFAASRVGVRRCDARNFLHG